MRFLKIEDIGEIVSGSTPNTQIDEYWNGDISWVTPKEINRLKTPYLNDTERKITEAGLRDCSTIILPKGSILFTSRAPIGLVAIANIDVATNQGFKSLKLYKGFYPLYIYHVLKFYSKRIAYLGNGSTFMELSKLNFSQFQVPIPDSIEDQIRIATLFDKIENAILQRKESIELAEEFVKSNFLELFGDPILNTKKWKKEPLKRFGKIITGNTPPRNNPSNYSTDYVEWIKSDNITEGHLVVKSASEYLSESGSKLARTVNSGALLVTCIAGSIDSIGRAALTDRSVTFNQQINAIQPNKDIYPNFLYWLVKINRQYIQRHATSAMKRILSKGIFEEIEMICPPEAIQKQFSELVQSIEELKLFFYDSLNELENFYGSITQNSFNNRLDLTFLPFDESFLLEYQNKDLQSSHVKSKEQKVVTIKNLTKKRFKKVSWDDVSMQVVANWIKNKYKNHHFNSEMMIRFFMDEHITFLNYFSSEELKKYPPLNSKDDLKKFLFAALNGDTPFIKLTQHFIDIDNGDLLNLPYNDDDNVPSMEGKSGIYFTIDES